MVVFTPAVIITVCLTQQQNQELGVQMEALSHSESDMMETNRRLRETLDRVREELRTARAQAERSQHEAERYTRTVAQSNTGMSSSFYMVGHI